MIAGAAVSSAVSGAAIFAGSALLGSIIGAVAGGITTNFINAAFSDKPGTQNPEAVFDREATSRLLTVRQAVSPWQWIYGQVRVGGIITYLESGAEYLHMVITLAGHPCEEVGDIYFDDEVIPLDGAGAATGTFAGFVRIKKSLGDEAAGVQPFSDLVAESGQSVSPSAPMWTSAHCQTGRTKIYVRLKWSADLFPNGIPNITAVVKGRKVLDPRQSPAITAWSQNAALCINDYLTHAIGLGATYASEIDEPQLIAAANICDENVERNLGSPTQYEDRYTMNGAFYVNNTPRVVLGRMLTAIAGSARFLGGTWGIYPAVYQTPTITLTEDHLRGSLHVTPRLSKRDLANGVKGIYVSPDNNWQASDFPAVTKLTGSPLQDEYLIEDQNERIWRELDLPFTTSAATAQRIARIELERVRQQITVDFPGTLSCYRLQPGDTVQFTFAPLGWTAKVFEVVSTSLSFDEDGEGGVSLGCNLSLRETASTIYDWSASNETAVDAAPDTNLPDPWTVAAPSGVTVTKTDDSDRVSVTWTVNDIFAAHHQLEYKLQTDSEWTVLPNVRSAQHEISRLVTGAYSVRVATVNQIGVTSSFANANFTIKRGYEVLQYAIMSGLICNTWTEQSNPKALPLTAVCYASFAGSPDYEPLYVAVGATEGSPGTDAYLITSLDGVEWIERSNPKNTTLNAVCASDSLLVAAGEPDGTDTYLITSPNGYTWTERSAPRNVAINALAWSDELSLFVGVGDPIGGSPSQLYIITSPDGVTWTDRTYTGSGSEGVLSGVVWDGTNNLFVAVGIDDAFATRALILTSPDGITWTRRTAPNTGTNYKLSAIAWNDRNLLCAVGADYSLSRPYVITSPDGITWTQRRQPPSGNGEVLAIASNGSLFVNVGTSASVDAWIGTSANGAKWVERSNPKLLALTGIAWSGSAFLAVGAAEAGGDAYIVKSAEAT